MKCFLIAAVLLVSCALAQQSPATVVDVLTADETFSSLNQAAETANLIETLSGDGL